MRATPSCARNLAALVATAIVCAPTPALAYRTLADVEGSPTPIVWEAPPTIGLDLAGSTVDGSLLTEELQAAVDVWNAVDCAAADIRIGTDPSSAPVVVRVVPDWAESGFDPAVAGVTDVVLASTASGIAVVGATLSLNGTMMWGPHPQDDEAVRDLRVVLVHELGHVLGLEHSEDPGATMYATYAGSLQADLAADDIAGLCSLYASPAPSCDGGCPEGFACIGGECMVPASEPQCGTGRPPCTVGACALAGNNEGQCIAEGTSGAACERGADCVSGLCVTGSGLSYCTVECSYDDQCAGMQRCAMVGGRSVCAPLVQSGCSAASGQASRSLLLPGLVILAAISLGRRRGASR